MRTNFKRALIAFGGLVILCYPNWLTYVPLIHSPAVAVVTPAIPTVQISPRDSTELIFTGDILLGRFVETLAERNDPGYLTQHLTDFMHDHSRIVITNFESAMAVPHVHSPNGSFAFSTQVENLITLTELNVQFASLANNHALDFGRSGYENTVNNLDMIGIKAFGHPTVFSAESAVYVQSGDYVIALVGIHTLFGVPDEAQVERVLAAIKAQSDIQIAYVHWGPEYRLTHAPPQAQFAATLVEHGVDAIIGHHPHVTQDVQLIQGVPVFYSLGNFIFDQYFSADVQAGYLLGLVVQADTLEFTFYPHDSRLGLSQTSLTNEPARTLFLQKLAKRSDQLLATDIASGTIKIPWKN